MTHWRRWVFEIRAPADEFLHHMQQALILRGIHVRPAEHFDFMARAFGVRAYIHATWTHEGIELRAKLKAGLFSSTPGLERILLDAGREAQAKLTYEKEP